MIAQKNIVNRKLGRQGGGREIADSKGKVKSEGLLETKEKL